MTKTLNDQPIVSVVFSFRNEEAVLPELLERLAAVLEPLAITYELIFVDDASTDRSAEILQQANGRDDRIRIITMSRRFGVAPCIMAGLRNASGLATVYMDADLQDPPELIPAMLKSWRAGADVVHTTRTKRAGEGRIKLCLSALAYRFISLLSDIDLPTNTGDFKLLSARARSEVCKLSEYDPYMRGLIRWIGFRQEFIGYERAARTLGETHFGLLRSINPLNEFLRGMTSFSVLPLWFALVTGISTALGSFFYLIYIVVTRVFWGMHLPGWPALMVTLLFLGGTILFTIGILGLYIGRIYQDSKGRPLYIIDHTVGFTTGKTDRC